MPVCWLVSSKLFVAGFPATMTTNLQERKTGKDIERREVERGKAPSYKMSTTHTSERSVFFSYFTRCDWRVLRGHHQNTHTRCVWLGACAAGAKLGYSFSHRRCTDLSIVVKAERKPKHNTAESRAR